MIDEDDKALLARMASASSVGALERSLDYDPADDPPEGHEASYMITERVCDRINEYLEDHGYQATATHFGLNIMTVKLHADSYERRQCQHTTEGVDPPRCAVMREMARDGWSQRQIAVYFDVVRGTARDHVVGRCSCEHDVPPHEYEFRGSRKVSDEMCATMNRLKQRGLDTHEIQDQVSIDVTRKTIREHIYGRCSCDTPSAATV